MYNTDEKILLHCKIKFLNNSNTAIQILEWHPIDDLPTENHKKLFQQACDLCYDTDWCIGDGADDTPDFIDVMMYIDNECWLLLDRDICNSIMEGYRFPEDGIVDNLFIWDYFSYDTYDELLAIAYQSENAK